MEGAMGSQKEINFAGTQGVSLSSFGVGLQNYNLELRPREFLVTINTTEYKNSSEPRRSKRTIGMTPMEVYRDVSCKQHYQPLTLQGIVKWYQYIWLLIFDKPYIDKARKRIQEINKSNS